MRLVLAALSATLILGPAPAGAQAMPFHTNTALPLPLAEAGVRSFFRYTDVGSLFRNGERTGNPEDLRVRIQALPLMVPYAVRPGTFVMVGVPYVRRSFQRESVDRSNRGFGDVTVLVKQELMAADVVLGNRRLALLASATLPTGETEEGGEVLPPPLRLGSGTTTLRGEAVYSYVQDRLGVHGAAGYALPAGSAPEDVRPGDAFSFDLALGYRLLPARLETLREGTLTAYLELNGTFEQSASRDGAPLEGTGGRTLFLSPGLQLIPVPSLAVEGSVQVPVLRRPRGTQLLPDWSAALGFRALVGPFGR